MDQTYFNPKPTLARQFYNFHFPKCGYDQGNSSSTVVVICIAPKFLDSVIN